MHEFQVCMGMLSPSDRKKYLLSCKLTFTSVASGIPSDEGSGFTRKGDNSPRPESFWGPLGDDSIKASKTVT